MCPLRNEKNQITHQKIMAINKQDILLNNKMDSLVTPFSPPPLCSIDPRTIVKEKDSVIAIHSDGKKIIGSLHKDGIKSECILIDTENESKPTQVFYDKVKMISLPDFKQWIELPKIEDEKIILDDQSTLDFSINFIDGDELKGKTMGFNTDRNGLYIFPTQKPGYFIYSFIPHNAIAKYQIGLKFGEQLVENNIVDKKQVDAALVEQEGKRNQLLGDYLKESALVSNHELEDALSNQKDLPNIKLGDLLVRERLITKEQLELALQEQKNNQSMLLGDILMNQGRISHVQLQQTLANKMGIPFVDISKLVIDDTVLLRIPEKIAKEHNIMPLEIFNGKIVVAMEEPLKWKILESLRFASSSEIIPVMASVEDIKQAIKVHYILETDNYYDESEEYFDEEFDESEDVSNNFIVRLTNKLIIDAYEQNASDIHLESNPGRRKTSVRFRKDGELFNYHAFSPKLRRSIIGRLKIMANLNVTERRRPQDGKIIFGRYSRLKIELRIVTMPTNGGEEDVVIRILASGEPIPLEQMQLNHDNAECIKYVLDNPHGLFLVCGPTGSGKTTLLHSLLKYLNTPDKKIWTVEDPVEITQDGLRQVQAQTGFIDFTTALRSFLRADPDIIMVGEMRDSETTKMCIEASLTGHLVLSTLHTNSAAGSIVRLLEMGMDPFNFSDALLGIVAQRLVKSLCPDCKEGKKALQIEIDKLLEEYLHQYEQAGITDETTDRAEKTMGLWKEKYANEQGDFLSYKANGCSTCSNTGFNGRIGLHEMLMVSDELRVAIYRQAKMKEILTMSLIEGMTTLKQDGIDKVLQGLTDINQVRKTC